MLLTARLLNKNLFNEKNSLQNSLNLLLFIIISKQDNSNLILGKKLEF